MVLKSRSVSLNIAAVVISRRLVDSHDDFLSCYIECLARVGAEKSRYVRNERCTTSCVRNKCLRGRREIRVKSQSKQAALAGCVKGNKIPEIKPKKARFECKRCGLLARKKGTICKPKKL